MFFSVFCFYSWGKRPDGGLRRDRGRLRLDLLTAVDVTMEWMTEGDEGGVEGGVGVLNGEFTTSVLTALMLRATERLADKMVLQWGHGK